MNGPTNTTAPTPRKLTGSVNSTLSNVTQHPYSRGPSGSSRNTSASSTSSSISSYGSRPPSVASAYRPQSAISHPRTTSYDLNPARSITALADHNASSAPSATKRNGMTLLSISALQQQDRLRLQKRRNRIEKGGFQPSINSREPATRSPSPFRTVSAEIYPFRNISLSTAFENLTLQTQTGEARDGVFPSPLKDQDCPKTPSYIPKVVPKTPRPVLAPQPQKTPLTKYKINHASPSKVTFLTRDSNVAAPAWDTKGRLEDMETLYSQLKSQFEGAASEKNSLEETLALYKTRCESIVAGVKPPGTDNTFQ